MFNRYILINEIINDIEINFFTSFLGKIEVNKRNDITIIYASYEDEEAINDALEAFIADSMSNMKIYYSKEFNNTDSLNKNLNFIINKFINTDLKKSLYNEVELALELISNNDIAGLDVLIDGNTENYTIKLFIENDLNTSKAASQAFMHRNTLINQINKYYKDTGYDVRKFKDAYVVYTLLKK